MVPHRDHLKFSVDLDISGFSFQKRFHEEKAGTVLPAKESLRSPVLCNIVQHNIVMCLLLYSRMLFLPVLMLLLCVTVLLSSRLIFLRRLRALCKKEVSCAESNLWTCCRVLWTVCLLTHSCAVPVMESRMFI